MTEILDEARNHRNDDDDHDDESEILLDDGDVAEEIAPQNEENDPADSPDDVIGDESPVGHPSDAGHEGGKRPDDRHKPGDDDGLASMLFIKRMGPVQVLLLEESRFFLMKNLGADIVPDPVIDRIPQDGCRNEQRDEPFDTKAAHRGECSGSEEKRVSGKKRRDDESGFEENDHEKDEIGPEAELLDDSVQMLIEMEDEIQNVF